MMNDMQRTDSKTMIITGASRGLGAAAAKIAASLGVNVVLNARSADKLAEVTERIIEGGGQAMAVVGDISQPDLCQQLVEQTIARFGAIDALINNAGIIEPIAKIADASAEAWQRNFTVNVLAPLMLTQAALPYLRAQKGHVINVSSGAASYAIPGWASYCASKAALNQFNEGLAKEESSITAIAVRPGIVDTEMQDQIRREGAIGMTSDDHKRFIGFYEQGHLQPAEVPARALVALALDAPHAWSGKFVSWDEEEVQALLRNGN